MSTVLQVADAVTSQLNAAALSQSFTAERLYIPNFELAKLNQLRVTVVPSELHVRSLDRNRNSYEAEIDIAVQKKFKQGSNAEIDPLIALVEEIADLFRLQRLASLPAAIWSRTEHQVLYSPEHWEQYRQFTSLLTVFFRLAR